jgi:Rab GDP dissociation inhibitor
MGIFEKRRMKKFMEFIGHYREEDPTTHQGIFAFVES